MKINKVLRYIILFLLFLPVLFYLTLLGLVKYDELSHRIEAEEIESRVSHSLQDHEIVLLNSGTASLWKRIDLIRSAKKSVELEYFIFELDRSSRIITRELMKKSKEGVKVRILVDFSFPIFKLNPIVAGFLNNSGIEVKYYNTATAWSLFDVQHRSHRKLLIVDGISVITGGRNVADDYFELSEKYNFFDSDIFIKGPIVGEMRQSFEVYWNSNLARPFNELKTKFSQEEMADSLNYMLESKEDDELLEKINQTGKNNYKNSYSGLCRDITFVSDHPGVSVAKRQVYKSLLKEASKAESSILVESPYFVLKDDGLNAIKEITERNVKFKVLTNSLNSTDAYYTVSALYANLKQLNRSAIEVWAYDGTPQEGTQTIPDIKLSERWGLHAKRGVLDDETTIIGTYNMDPRSANLNSELIVICRKNSELAAAVRQDREKRLLNSKPIVQQNCLHCSTSLWRGADWISTIKFIGIIPIAGHLDFLL